VPDSRSQPPAEPGTAGAQIKALEEKIETAM
jgi:hypothetical protein